MTFSAPDSYNKPNTLYELQEALKIATAHSEELDQKHSENQRVIGSLRKAIGVIEQNLEAFEKDGDELKKDFENAKT